VSSYWQVKGNTWIGKNLRNEIKSWYFFDTWYLCLIYVLFVSYSCIYFSLVCSVSDCVPIENCIFDLNCLDFCHDHGYNKGECTRRFTSRRMSRMCHCFDCNPLRCIAYCKKKDMKFSGCMCFNLTIPSGPLIENMVNRQYNNECNDSNLYCQCGA